MGIKKGWLVLFEKVQVKFNEEVHHVLDFLIKVDT